MRPSDSTRIDPVNLQARVVVSLSYVKTLRSEVETGRINAAVLEDYLERLEAHLLEVERDSARLMRAGESADSPLASGTGEDRLISIVERGVSIVA